MATATLTAYSGAYPSITNRLRASVAYASSPLALVASIIEDAPHNVRTWDFDGLPRNNYRFYLDEIDGSGNVVDNKADFNVVPGIISGTLARDDEQIQVDNTYGLVSGQTSWTLDGSETSPGSGIFKKDYRGWDIVIDECTGRDILVTGLDYSWNSTLGTFQLLQAGDTLQAEQWYNIHFNTQNNTQGNSYPSVNDFTIRLVTANSSLTVDDFGNKVIVEPASNYIEINLPDINTVVEGRKCMIEGVNSTTPVCAKFIPAAGQVINFLDGNLFLYPNESFSVYCFSRSGTKEWRICDEQGNFKTVGNSISNDNTSVINSIPYNGASVNRFTYARLYNMVLNLPIAQVVAYADHEATVNSKCLYSFANVSDNFYVPDRRDLFERNSGLTTSAGTYHKDTVIFHKHKESIGSLPTPPFGEDPVNQTNNGQYKNTGTNKPDYTSDPIDNSGVALGDTETQPKNYRMNKFVLI